MAQDTDATESRLTGEAAWRAARDATEQRNAAAKRHASERPTPTIRAARERERRLAVAESAQLRALNERISARAPGSDH